MAMINAIIKRESQGRYQSASRPGLSALPLITKAETDSQNLVLMQMAEGAEVELHKVKTHESLFVLEGRFTLVLPEGDQPLKQGDVAYFPDQSEHGLKCETGPGKFLLVFAPPVTDR